MTIEIEGRVREAGSGGGLQNVCVSNGEHVVRTGAGGRYELKIEPGEHRFVWVTVPDGFRLPADFYHSTRDWDASRRDVDFDLVPAPGGESRTLRLAHVTDTHVGAVGYRMTGEIVQGDLQDLIGEAAPDLIVVTGDLTDWGAPPELESFREAAGSVAVPVLPMFGGHDGNRERFGDLSADRLAELKRNREQAEIRRIVRRQEGVSFTRNYEEVLGPAWYSFDRGGRHFVLYPNEENFLSPRDRERKQAWLLADLAAQPAGREVVVFLHIPPPVAFLDLLSGSGARLVLHGHWHSSKLFAHGGMVIAATPPIGIGGLDTRPRGYRLVDFGEGQPQIALRPLVQGGSPASREEPPITLEEGSGPLEIRWTHRLPAGLHRAAPVASDGRVLVSLAHEEDPGGSGVACVDGRSGGRQWLTATDSAVKNSVALGPGSCAALSVAGRLHLLETASGRVRWQADLPGFPERWIYTSPVIAGDAVFVGNKGGCGAFDLETGAQRWYVVFDTGDDGPCYAGPRVWGDLLVVFVPRRGVLALDRREGRVAWERSLYVEHPLARPVLAGDLLVSGSEAPEVHWYHGDPAHLIVLRAQTGETVWHRPVLPSRYPAGLAVREDRIFATTPDGEALCMDLHSGELLWSYGVGEDLLDMVTARRQVRSILADPVLHGDRVLVGANDGCLHVLNTDTGACESRTSFGSPISASVCLTGDGICLGTYDGRLFGLGPYCVQKE